MKFLAFSYIIGYLDEIYDDKKLIKNVFQNNTTLIILIINEMNFILKIV